MITNAHEKLKGYRKVRHMDSESRNQEIYQMRLKGMSLHDISQVVKLTPARVSQIVTQCLDEVKELNLELGKRMLEMELERLDKLALALHTQAMTDGDPRAIDSYLKIMERRAKMIGLDLGKEESQETAVKVYVGFNGPDDWEKEQAK